MKLYKLKFKSSIHLGERENFLETTEAIIHSDTLFSAFCNCYFLLYGKERLENLLKEFISQKPLFLISSCFPLWDDKLYFPIPLNQMPIDKKIKKVEFIEKDGFEKLLDGRNIKELIDEGYKTIPDLKAEKEDDKRPYKIVNTPRVNLNRLTAHPGDNFFHFGEVFYKENSGLFFLVEFIDNRFEKEFKTTLRLMADEGIGGDRTVGKGLFEQREEEINITFSKDANGFVILSLYHPKKEESFDLKDGYYEIVERKGYIFSPHCKSLRKKSIRMFKEGSVFPSKKIGDLVDITPEIFKPHNVFRYGFSFGLPCKLEIKDED